MNLEQEKISFMKGKKTYKHHFFAFFNYSIIGISVNV